MTEGWSGEDYLILFSEAEQASAEARYSFSGLMPSFKLIGLRGWDDFIVKDIPGHIYCIPAVPVDLQYLAPYAATKLEAGLVPDPRFTGKIRWYVKPVAFASDADLGSNITWVEHGLHGQLVKWWNDLYLSQGRKGRQTN